MATTVSHQRIPRNPRAGIAPRVSRLKMALDQVIPKQRTAIPSVQGIAEQKRVLECVKRMSNVVDSIRLVNDAAEQANDPDLQAYAASLLADPRFLRLIGSHVEQIRAAVEKAIGTPAPTTAKPNEEKGTVAGHREAIAEEERGEQNDPARGSGMPGTDAALYAPGAYTVEHLGRDLAARTMAPRFFAQRNPRGGMDAALGEVSKIQFFPDWTSECWTPEARKAFRDRASFDNELTEILRSHGDSPTYQNEHNATRSSLFFSYLNTED